MTVITINGQIGAGGQEIGAEVAKRLHLDYVDRLILAEAAKRLSATVEALVEREQRSLTRNERIARFLQTLVERSAVGSDPYFGGGIGVVLGQEYQDAVKEPITRADQVRDEQFIEATRAVIQELARAGNAVIIGRASNLILKGYPDAFHVGLVSTVESRIKVMAEREGVSLQEAERSVNEAERARVVFFKKFFRVSADDPANFHMILNTHALDSERAASIIVQAVS
ncbi:MAG: cytidylate kinase-like family protein [Dehalococcoidia bacterium]|nr:cytidylate kinase-like family protein [Dehalococcoidia bacterium]